MGRLPLEGIRVLDITQIWAGPFTTQLLADWGAEVIRIESTQIAPISTRVWSRERIAPPPGVWWLAYPDWELGGNRANRFALFNVHARNKQSVTMDLTRPEGRQVFDRLLQVSDVLVENNTPTTMAKLEIDYEVVRRQRPDIVMVRMPGFGLNGPYRDYRSMGNHAEAIAGHTWLRNYTDTDFSAISTTTVGDGIAGQYAAFAAMSALRARRHTGKGCLIELAQIESMASFMPRQILEYAVNCRIPTALGNRHWSLAPHDCFPCKGEDQWVTIAIGTDDEWEAFVQALGSPEWANERRFATVTGRYNNQDEIGEHITRWTLEREPYEIATLLQAHSVAAGPVIFNEDAFSDPQYKARGFFERVTQDDCGTHLHPGIMWKASDHPNGIRTPPCQLGEHNPYIYSDLLGYGEDDYARMETEGHIGTSYVIDNP